MRRTGPNLYSLSPGGRSSSTTAVDHLPESIAQDWRDVHTLLANRDWSTCSLPDLFDLTVYHYCVYKSFGEEQDAALPRGLFNQLTETLAQQTFSNWPTARLDQLCTLAWLGARSDSKFLMPGEPLLLLAGLDQSLLQKAQSLPRHPGADSRRNFFCILRYFSLRLPNSGAESCLRQLLARRPDLNSIPNSIAEIPPEPLQLGLADGLAGELLVLMKLYRAGIHDSAPLPKILASFVSVASSL